MKNIQPKLINELNNIDPKNVASSDAYEVETFKELKKLIAKLSYANKDYILFFRGQNKDYRNPNNKSTFYPTIYRGDPLQKEELKHRWRKLYSASNLLVTKIKQDKNFENNKSIRKKLVQWSLLQHYEVTETPLIDVTQSLKVACSFAVLNNKNEYAYIFVFGLPYYTNRISVNSEQYLTNIRLISIAPPEALRPYFQEGFLVGEDEFNETYFNKSELDLNNRLIAKFKFKNDKQFWGDYEKELSENELYPTDDPIAELCYKIKEELFENITNAKEIITPEEYKNTMLIWMEIEKYLKLLPNSFNGKYFLSPSIIIKRIENNQLRNNLENARKQRNMLAHNFNSIGEKEINGFFSSKELSDILLALKNYIKYDSVK